MTNACKFLYPAIASKLRTKTERRKARRYLAMGAASHNDYDRLTPRLQHVMRDAGYAVNVAPSVDVKHNRKTSTRIYNFQVINAKNNRVVSRHTTHKAAALKITALLDRDIEGCYFIHEKA